MKTTMAILGILVAAVLAAVSSYNLMTGEHNALFTQLLLGAMFLVLGFGECREKRKPTAIIAFLTSGFSLFVGIDILLS
ncbi:YczI family protein [Salicibibacter kimchii]|nr:YczI family protein [Salicibibacter kimchii]